MSHDAGEVSWHTLRRIVHEWSGESSDIEQVVSLDGGSISTTLLVTTKAGEKGVLKVSPHRVDRSFERETHQLGLLRSIGLPAPKVHACHVGTLDSPDSYILMEYLPGMNLHDARKHCTPEEFDELQCRLAEMVIELHKHAGEHYGKVESHANGAHPTWPDFYRSLYDAIWHECEKHAPLQTKTKRAIGKIHDRLEKHLKHEDHPRLTHGDLWWSNVLADRGADGKWKITGVLDPNCKYAHAECELAYLELFQTSTPAFLKHYQQTFRLGEEYHKLRKPIYQLYELINHVNLFGERYLKPLQATLDKLAGQV